MSIEKLPAVHSSARCLSDKTSARTGGSPLTVPYSIKHKKELTMKEFKSKVAVITGAASGIGRGLAERCLQEDMRVVLADIETPALEETEMELKARYEHVLAVQTDVSREDDIEQLAKKTLEKFGAVHLLFNNAGVEVRGAVWEQTPEDWQWIINVNLWGVIHGIRVFVPRMLEQKTECHIVNTASTAALITGPGLGSYRVTKSGVIALSETLYHELKLRNAQIGVSVLYPAFVRSRLVEAERNRPAEFRNQKKERSFDPYEEEMIKFFQETNRNAMPPEQFARQVFKGIKENKFYIQTHPEKNQSIRLRMEDILQSRNPKL